MKTKQLLTITLIVLSLSYMMINLNSNEKMKIENNYEYVENDPLNARVYTLDNGLKVYLTSYVDAPRVQTNIAVRASVVKMILLTRLVLASLSRTYAF